MQETRVRSLGREDPLEKEMATHSSVLAWRIPGTSRVAQGVSGPPSSCVWNPRGSKKDPLLSEENKTSIRNTGEAEGAEVSCQSEEGASRRVRKFPGSVSYRDTHL